MYQYIEQLRKKPYHHKRRVALGASTIITGAIFIAWLSVILPSNTSQIVAQSEIVKVSTQNSSTNQGNTPLETLKNSTAQVYEAAKALFSNTVSSENLQNDYAKMKNQVQTGQIKLAPQDSPNSQ